MTTVGLLEAPPATTNRIAPHPTTTPRVEVILTVATEILYERGEVGLTMVEIARRAKISRQLLYTHFHNPAEILEALFVRCLRSLELESLGAREDDVNIANQMQWCVKRLFEAPASVVHVMGLAFHGDRSEGSRRIRRHFDDSLERCWVEPLGRLGLNWEVAKLGVTAIVLAALQFRQLIEDGAADAPVAHAQITRMIDSLLHGGSPEPRVELTVDPEMGRWFVPPIASSERLGAGGPGVLRLIVSAGEL